MIEYRTFEKERDSEEGWWFVENQEDLKKTYKRKYSKSSGYIWIISLQIYLGRKLLQRFETWI